MSLLAAGLAMIPTKDEEVGEVWAWDNRALLIVDWHPLVLFYEYWHQQPGLRRKLDVITSG